MAKILKAILLFFVLVVINSLTAQTYNFINYNVGEGLEQSDILCVNQAANGYLLYGSNGGGLGYYDGYTFKAIREKDGLSNNVVYSITKDKENNVWIATNSGVTQLSSNLKQIKNIFSEDKAFICTHFSKKDEKIYFGSLSGVYFFNGDSLQVFNTENDDLNSAFINSIYTDSKNNLWIATRQKGLFKIDQNNKVLQFTIEDGLPSNFIKAIIESKDKIWVGSIKGLSLIESDTISEFELPNDADGHLTITSASKYKDELVFGALNSHSYFVNPLNNSFRIINEQNGFNFKKVWSLYTDSEENLWFGTIGQGLSKFNSTFTYFNQKNGLLSSYINTIFCDNEEIWLGYKSNGVNVIKDNKIIKSISTKELGSSIINKITKIDNTIYLGRNGGLSKYKDEKIQNFDFESDIQNDIYSIYKYRKKLYIGTKMGLYIFKNDSLKPVKDTPEDFIFDIIDYNDKIYLASNKGYYVYDGKTFDFVGETEDFNAGRVRSFVIDKKNNLWIGTSEGLYVKSNNSHSIIDEEKGLSSDNVYFLQIDIKDNIWIGTNKGVDRLKIESYYDGGDLKIRNFSKSEGMIGVECNLNAVGNGIDNQLWIGTINGAYLYNEKGDQLNTIPPRVSLNNIKLNFNDVIWKNYTTNINPLNGLPDALELSHTNNNFIFEYVGISLKNPEKVLYQYKLKGLDEDWLPLTKDRKAVYTALTPGDYTFILKAKNNDDVWVNEPLTFSFTIFPPWYQTNWFYTSVVLLIVLAIYLFISIRTRNLKKTQQKLTQQVDERTSELREEKEKVEHINLELGEQKKVIEVANKNITDSINYAKRIQEAILPKGNKLDKYEDNLGVLYLPKDVVSGDFYWFDKLGDKLIIAAADCTGHGVPGAFMSMIGVNNLNQIILENKETNPSKILTQLNVAIKKVLRQEDVGSESKDGMDISICTFDTKNNTVQYAGAFRPLLYIRDNELLEIKGSRNPIGGNAPSDFIYELNQIDIKKDDVFYMFSDGYPDQFGGAKGKKFMNKRLKQIFIDHHKKSPDEQREILKEEFYNWMGNEEQIDDILVMCMKF